MHAITSLIGKALPLFKEVQEMRLDLLVKDLSLILTGGGSRASRRRRRLLN
jgi:hypothetical protein